jgi:CheY-like chemotaxis protein
MNLIYLIHWNAKEADEKAKRLIDMGYRAVCGMPNAAAIRKLRDDPPDAFVIDLGRLPTQGRDVALVIRQSPAIRHAPIVFVDGDSEKVSNVKKHLPDAVFTSWTSIKRSLEAALLNPPTSPVVPKSVLAGYSGTPLPKKLGIKPECKIMLIGPPAGFKELVGELPDSARYISKRADASDLIIWFVKSQRELEAEIRDVASLIAPQGGLWICWPKKTSGIKSDLSENWVRHIGLASGLVDYKVCAIDQIWSGLKFARRKVK